MRMVVAVVASEPRSTVLCCLPAMLDDAMQGPPP